MRCLAVALLVCALPACFRDRPEVERFAGIRSALPGWRDRSAFGTPASGSLERHDRLGAAASLAWDADERSGTPGEQEAMVAAGLPGAVAAAAASPVGGHAAVEVSSPEAKTLVWRCDKTRRLFRLSLNQRATEKADLAELAAGIGCHIPGDKPVNGDVPVADTSLLGPGWQFARRQPAAAAWLRQDAVLTLFAGERTQAPHDPEAALRTSAAWAQAAGLKNPAALSAKWVPGPGKHQALRTVGRGTLDGRTVRFTLLQWRCIARARSFAALVFTTEPSQPPEPSAPGKADAGSAPWTPHDSALLAVRCHG